MSKKFVSPADYISPININGLEGRLLKLKAVYKHNKKEILVIYDQHSNLERWWGLDSALRQYGNITAVDLPGLGGMESFYKIGIKPSINNYADYLDSFIKLRYKKSKFTIFAIGFGSVVVTTMLQRNPQISARVNLVVGMNAYAHYSDLKLSKKSKLLTYAENVLVSLPTGGLAGILLKATGYLNSYMHKISSKQKADPFTRKFSADLEKSMDIRTLIYIQGQLTKLNNCDSRIDLPFWNISLGDQKLLKPEVAEQHLRVVFTSYRQLKSKLTKVPFIIKDERMGQRILPAALRRELKKPVH